MGGQVKKRVGIVADDITGANDIGLMFSKNGMRTAVFPFGAGVTAADFAGLDVAVLDTDSRFDDAQTAAAKAAAATKLLMQAGFDLYFNKTCSVFRGNIGAEFDAMQDTLGVRSSMVVLGFPKLGRTTVNGVHYLSGVPINESPFVNDPIHPTREPHLQKIIAQQSSRPSALFTAEWLDKPPAQQREHLQGLKESNAYIIFDVRHQQDLAAVARLVQNERNICGSSAIGEELPAAWGIAGEDASRTLLHPLADDTGTLILAGSLTEATRAQTQHLLNAGTPAAMLSPLPLLQGSGARHEMVRGTVQAALPAVRAGQSFLVYTQNSPEAVAAGKAAARARGLNDADFGKLLSSVLGQIAREVVQATGAHKLVVAGGDTSMAVSAALGLRKMVILQQIEPGVPAMYGYGPEGELLLVLKSGSFGSPGFLQTSDTTLRTMQQGCI